MLKARKCDYVLNLIEYLKCYRKLKSERPKAWFNSEIKAFVDHHRAARRDANSKRDCEKKIAFCHFVNLRFEVDTIYDKLISCIYGARASLGSCFG